MAFVEEAFVGHRVAFVYHYPCLDGAYACLCASLYFTKKFPSVVQRFVPFRVNDDSERDFTGEPLVIFLDILPKAVLEAAMRQAELVVVVDHHLTNQKTLEEYKDEGEFPANLFVQFDLEFSAAKLAYIRYESVIQNDQLRIAVDYVEDYDLWRWGLPDTEAVICYMQDSFRKLDYNQNPETLSLLASVDIEQARRLGERLHKARKMEIAAELERGPKLIQFPGYRKCLGLVTRKSHLKSHLGNELAILSQAQGHLGVGMVARRNYEGDYEVSVRAIGDDVDVSRICEIYGGGGHAKAAGMRVDEQVFKSWLVRNKKKRRGRR